jgi:hypothetical protein
MMIRTIPGHAIKAALFVSRSLVSSKERMPRSAVNTQPGKRWQQILPKLLGNQGRGYYLVALIEILADAAYM